MKLFLSLLILTINIFSQSDVPSFYSATNMGELTNDDIDEASGIASSYKNKGILWTHNDSGGENRIFAIDTNGISRGVYYISGAVNRDWEDIVVGPGPVEGVSYLYIADIGDNDSEYSEKFIFRVPEPEVPLGQENITQILIDVETITFKYPDNERDAETLLIDPTTKDLYVVGKRDTKVRLYKIAYPQLTNTTFYVELAAQLTLPDDPEDDTPYNYITSGSISLDGTEILLKSYRNVYYWSRENGTTIADAMSVDPEYLTYTQEPQGEAIGWKNYGNNGYFTLSEETGVSVGDLTFYPPAQLYYYERSSLVAVEEFRIDYDFNLEQNYPNPFNPTTSISYSIPKESEVRLRIYDNLGEEIFQLVNEKQEEGKHEIIFDASKLVSGIYYYSLNIDGFVQTKKMVVLK